MVTAHAAEGDRPFGEGKHTDEQDKDKDRVAVEVEADFKVGSRSRFGSVLQESRPASSSPWPSINQSVNQSFNPSSSLMSPALSFHIPFKLAGPGRCGTDPARFKLSLFPDRHQVISRQTAAVETKTHKRRTTDRRAPSWLVAAHNICLGHTYCTRDSSQPPHITHNTQHTTRQHRSVYST